MARRVRAANARLTRHAGETRIRDRDGAALGIDRPDGASADPERVGGGSARGAAAEQVPGDLRGSRDVLLRRFLRPRSDRGGPELPGALPERRNHQRCSGFLPRPRPAACGRSSEPRLSSRPGRPRPRRQISSSQQERFRRPAATEPGAEHWTFSNNRVADTGTRTNACERARCPQAYHAEE